MRPRNVAHKPSTDEIIVHLYIYMRRATDHYIDCVISHLGHCEIILHHATHGYRNVSKSKTRPLLPPKCPSR